MERNKIIDKVMEKFGKKKTTPKEMRPILLKFFKNNPKIKDIDVKELADKYDLDHSKMEAMIYKLLIDILRKKQKVKK